MFYDEVSSRIEIGYLREKEYGEILSQTHTREKLDSHIHTVWKFTTTFSLQPPLLHQINEATGKPGELRLKIRSLTGTIVYLVHVSADESVTRLYELLNKTMQTPGQRECKVVLSG